MTGVYEGSYKNMFIAISPDAYVVAISMGRSIGVFTIATGQLEEMLENVHTGKKLPHFSFLWSNEQTIK